MYCFVLPVVDLVFVKSSSVCTGMWATVVGATGGDVLADLGVGRDIPSSMGRMVSDIRLMKPLSVDSRFSRPGCPACLDCGVVMLFATIKRIYSAVRRARCV